MGLENLFDKGVTSPGTLWYNTVNIALRRGVKLWSE